MLPIVMEILAYVPTAVQLGVDVSGIIERAIALYNKPTPATPEELAALQQAINDEKARLAAMTEELDTDPPSP